MLRHPSFLLQSDRWLLGHHQCYSSWEEQYGKLTEVTVENQNEIPCPAQASAPRPELWRRLRLEGLQQDPGQNTAGGRDCQGLRSQNSHFHATPDCREAAKERVTLM